MDRVEPRFVDVICSSQILWLIRVLLTVANEGAVTLADNATMTFKYSGTMLVKIAAFPF